MRSHSPLAHTPEATERREPSLARDDAPPPRLVPPERLGAPRAAVRGASVARLELHAGERAVVASTAVRAPGELGRLLKKLGLALLGLLALIGAATLLRPFVGL